MSSVSAPDVFDQKQTEICPNHQLCLFLPHPCSCSLLDYKFLGVCVPCAECQQQLRLNSNWHLMISCYLALSLSPAALVTHSHCPAGAAPVAGTPPAPTLPIFAGGGGGPPAAPSSAAAAVAAATNLSALASQHRLLELSRFGLRGYDLAQHMLSQQGAVSKLLGKYTTRGRGGGAT